MAGPSKDKEGKKAASPPAMFAICYAADLGKVAKLPGSSWNLRGDEASELPDCTIADCKAAYIFPESSKTWFCYASNTAQFLLPCDYAQPARHTA
jgi:hypothetical protein